MTVDYSESITWVPRSHNGGCAFAAAVGESAILTASIEHNANWANAHGTSFTLFRKPSVVTGVHPQWEKVSALRQLLQRESCRWLMHIDSDAVVTDVEKSPTALLAEMQAEAAPASPLVYASCNSPLGRGFDCDVFCCGRAKQSAATSGSSSGGSEGRGRASSSGKTSSSCTVGLHDVGPASPYPCMINSGVFFVRNVGALTSSLVEAWWDKRRTHAEVFGEQASVSHMPPCFPRNSHVLPCLPRNFLGPPLCLPGRLT